MTVRERVLDLLFPPKCPFCQKILAEPRAPVCPECRPGLPWLEGAAGERQVDFADGCFSPLAYRGTVPQAVHRYKFSRVRALGRPFAAVFPATRSRADRAAGGAGGRRGHLRGHPQRLRRPAAPGGGGEGVLPHPGPGPKPLNTAGPPVKKEENCWKKRLKSGSTQVIIESGV